jgi:hypothetical protein
VAFSLDDSYGPRDVTAALERELNQLGSEGWEAIWVRKSLDDEDDEIAVIAFWSMSHGKLSLGLFARWRNWVDHLARQNCSRTHASQVGLIWVQCHPTSRHSDPKSGQIVFQALKLARELA